MDISLCEECVNKCKQYFGESKYKFIDSTSLLKVKVNCPCYNCLVKVRCNDEKAAQCILWVNFAKELRKCAYRLDLERNKR